jgi:hypothetical protein
MGCIGKFAKLIGFGVIGIIALVVVIAVATGNKSSGGTQTTGAGQGATPEPLAAVGQNASAGNWKVEYQKIEAAGELGKTQFTKGTPAQGQFLIMTLAATNLHKETSTLNTTDFRLKSADGTTYKTSNDGQFALISDTSDAPKPFTIAEQIQPGLTKKFRLVFDVNPAVRDYTMEAAGVKFAVTIP